MTHQPTPDDVRATARTLAWIRSYDAGFPRADEAMVLAWARAFARHQLAPQDLEAGVDALFADDTRPRDRVLPADVIRQARKHRADRAEREKATGTEHALTTARQATIDCPMCDPNGWIETDTGLRRCGHNPRLETR